MKKMRNLIKLFYINFTIILTLYPFSGFAQGYNSNQKANSAPELSDDYVSPTSGMSIHKFVYFVTYRDGDGDSPASILVHINVAGDENSYNMIYVSGSISTGAVYKYSTKLPKGEHQFHFSCSDGNGGTDQTSTQNGPTVLNTPPEVTITSGPSGDVESKDVTFQWQGSDSDGSVVSYDIVMDLSEESTTATSKTFYNLSTGSPADCLPSETQSSGPYLPYETNPLAPTGAGRRRRSIELLCTG